MLMQVWLWHYCFFRRYGLQDRQTLLLNIALLFVILFYIYPLKFLFLLFSDELLGLGTGSMIQDAQWPSLMIIYSLGFLAVQCLFALLYSHAYRKRAELELNEIEVYLTWRRLFPCKFSFIFSSDGEKSQPIKRLSTFTNVSSVWKRADKFIK